MAVYPPKEKNIVINGSSYDKLKVYTLDDFKTLSTRELRKLVTAHMYGMIRNTGHTNKEGLANSIYDKHNEIRQKILEHGNNGDEEKEEKEELENAPLVLLGEEYEEEKKIENEEKDTLTTFSKFITDKFQNITHFKVDGKWWWYANEIAKLFEYKDYNNKIKNLKCPKITYETITVLCTGKTPGPDIIQNNTIFIEKRGILKLVLNSNMPLAIQFQDLLIDDIIPSILQYGMYISPSITSQQIENLQKQLEIEKQKTEQLQLQLEHIPSLQLTDVQENQLKNMKKVKKSYIYIITCKFYASNKLFKVGRSNNTSSRLNTLNTPMITDKLHFYICCRIECCDAFNTEKIIHEVIKTFLFEKEFYKIAYLKLKEIVELCCYGINNVYDKLLELDHILDDNTIPEELILTTTKKEDDNTIFKKINTITNYYT